MDPPDRSNVFDDKFATRFGLSKLSAACLCKSAQIVSTVLEESNSSSQGRHEVNGDGWTPVHFACLNKKEGPAILKVLVERAFSLQVLTNSGSSPLHEASRNGNSDCVRLILEHMLENSPADLETALELKNKDGDTPLHLACRSGHKTTVNVLLNYGYDKVPSDAHRHSVCLSNADNATPLGLAIEGNHMETARLLFDYLPSGNPLATLKDFSSFCPHARLIGSLRAAECQPMNVYFLGDSGTGKSTFIKTLQAHSQSTLSALYTLLPYVSHPADTHKVGVVPTAIDYPRRNHQCPIVFHDITGHRNYAHEALFKYADKPLESLFLITVDVRDSEDVIKGKVLYWLNFLTYAASQYLAKSRSPVKQHNAAAKLDVMIIGTFNDQMPRFSKPQVILTTICRLISNENPELLSHFEWKGSYALNTHRAYSWKMIQLRSVLQEKCQRVHFGDNTHCDRVTLQSYLLAAVVWEHLLENSASVTTFEKVIEYVKSSDNMSCQLLRKADGDIDRVEMMELCRSLKRFSQYSVYETSHSSPTLHKRFIIQNLHQLLSDINTTVEYLPHSHGIISHTDLRAAFQRFNFPTGFIIEFMESFQICEGVTGDGLKHMRQQIRTSRRSLSSSSFRRNQLPQKQTSNCETPPVSRSPRNHKRTMSYPLHIDEVLKVSRSHSASQSENIDEGSSSSQATLSPLRPVQRHSSNRQRNPRQKEVPYSFFPTLVSSQPPDKWNKDYDKYTYGFAWSLTPNSGKYYFPPRFVTVLLFRLLHAFAPFKTGYVHQHEKVCELWSWGIAWQDSNGTRACVTIHDSQTITLSMQCLQNQELECLKLRNQVVSEIVSQKHELHPEIKMSHVLIPDDQKVNFPVYDPADAPASFDKMEIGAAILKREPVLNCTLRKNHVKVNDLLFLEPLTLIPSSLLQQLLDEESQDDKMNDEFCLDLAKEISDNWQLLAQYFDLHSSYIADVKRGNEAVNRAPYWAALEVICHLRDSVGQGKGVHTYGELRDALLDISIFSEEELNDLLGIKLHCQDVLGETVDTSNNYDQI